MNEDIKRFEVGARFSEAAVFHGVVYLAGMVPEGGDNDVAGQTVDVLAQIDRHLLAAGSDKTRILRAQIFLADISEIGAMNAVWDAWVVPGSTPPRATVQVAYWAGLGREPLGGYIRGMHQPAAPKIELVCGRRVS